MKSRAIAGERQTVKLRFGVLCDGTHLQRWQMRSLQGIAAIGGATAAVLLVPCDSTQSIPQGGYFFHKILGGEGLDSQQRRIPIDPALAALPVLQLPGGIPSSRDALRCSDRSTVREYDLDFILCFADFAAGRQLGQDARYGVWAFCFGDWEQYRGDPAGFWEVHDGVSTTSAMLVRLSGEPNEVTRLRSAHLRTKRTGYRRNREHVLSRIAHWPAQVCIDILQGDLSDFASESLHSSVPWRTPPGNFDFLVHVFRLGWFVLIAGFRSLMRYDHWNIGIVDQPIADFIDPAKPRRNVRWLPSRPTREFLADPFGVLVDGKLTIICEHLDYRDGVGVIASITEDQGVSINRVEIGPNPAVHMSYPYLLEHNGQLLCIPETHQAREVSLYVSERFPLAWSRVAILLADVEVVDATMFYFQGYWWIAAADAGIGSPSADLFLWYSESAVGPWAAHIGNPVKTDVRSARPAGTPFVVDGVLYRPSMDCSETYGGRVVINRVLVLTPNKFKEASVAAVEPSSSGPYPDGLHTLAAVGNITLIDGKRLVFVWAEFWRTLRRLLLGLLVRQR